MSSCSFSLIRELLKVFHKAPCSIFLLVEFIHPLGFPYHSNLISLKYVSNTDYVLPVSQVPQTLHIQSQTHHLTFQTYFSSPRLLFHERHLFRMADPHQNPASFSFPLYSQIISKALNDSSFSMTITTALVQASSFSRQKQP